MKILNPIGSKERFLEMFQGVNKIQMNEVATDVMQTGTQLLEKAFDELKNKQANIKQTNTQTVGEDNFVEIITNDNDGNEITFTFKINSTEADQDGVYNVNNAVLTSFKIASENFNVDWDDNMKFVQEFNANRGSEIMNVVSEFANFETDTMSVDDEVYEEAVKLIDKVPYKKSTETMQTSKAYGDEKPTNPDLRVQSDELNKFVSEMENYINGAEAEEDILALPPDYSATDLPTDIDDDGSKGIDPYDQAIASAERGESEFEIERPEKKTTGERTRAIPKWAEAFMENKGVVTDMDADNMITHGYENTLSPEVKEDMIKAANEMLEMKLGANKFKISQENYIKMVKDLAIQIYRRGAADMNEESEKNDYPDPIGKKFKPKRQFPKKKKKPQSVVKLSEDEMDGNSIDIDMEDKIEGGLADDKSTSDFCPKQLAMGLEVEMREHTDDPKVALEIAMDHLVEDPNYYGTDEENPEDMARMHAQADVEQETGEIETPENQDDEETDELLGYKPHNVNDYSNEEFDYAGAEKEYHDKEGYDDNVDNKNNDIPENFWREFQGLIDEFGERVVYYLFNNGLRGYYETRVKGNYSIDAIKQSLGMLKVPEINEDDGMEEYQGDIGDRYQDGEGNQFSVRNKVKGGVSLQGQGGEKEIATSDIQFLKKLSEEKLNNYKNWGSSIPYGETHNLKRFGTSLFKPTDDRTGVLYYLLSDNYVVADKGNYAIYGFLPNLGGVIKKNDRLFNRSGADITDDIRNDAKNYSNISDDLKEFIFSSNNITESQINLARQVLNNRNLNEGMSKKEAVQILIKHNIE